MPCYDEKSSLYGRYSKRIIDDTCKRTYRVCMRVSYDKTLQGRETIICRQITFALPQLS